MASESLKEQIETVFANLDSYGNELYRAIHHKSNSKDSLVLMEAMIFTFAKKVLSDDEIEAAAIRAQVRDGKRKLVPRKYQVHTPPEP